jgi:hypothetical protein
MDAWTEGRHGPLAIHVRSSQPRLHDAAEAFLQEFGGLTVNVSGPGISCARTPFELDPELAWGEDDRFTEWGEAIGRHLCPLGELDHGRFFLGIDEVGVIYLVETWVASFGAMLRTGSTST